MKETIRRVNGYGDGAYTYYPVVIVGGGASGIAAGCRLKEKLGCDQFRIFERQSGIGGTWWINRYPGVACDVPAVFYSFSFCPNPRWTAFHPSGPEIVQYLQSVCEQYQIYDKIQLDTDVELCRWLEDEQVWEVTLRHLVGGAGDLSATARQAKVADAGEQAVWSHRETVRARVLVSCVGGLVEPNEWPSSVPGIDGFRGALFHSARWDASVDLAGKDVVVVGSGCSAAQLVPRLTQPTHRARSVTQIMRSPPWVVPRIQPPGGDAGWHRWAPRVFSTVPGLLRLFRFLVFLRGEYDWRLFGGGAFNARARAALQKDLLAHMRATVPEKYHAMLTPDYDVACKRRIFDASWFPGLHDPKIELTTLPMVSVQERSVTLGPRGTFPSPGPDAKAPGQDQPDGDGGASREIPADVIVLANGFQVARYMHPLHVRGRRGADLLETMEARGGPQAYQGTAMDGFPNLFLVFGPNTATGHSSVIMASESMVEYMCAMVAPVLRGEATTVEVKEEAERAYTRDIQRQLQHTVWQAGGCSSWYFRDDGWNGTVYPYTQFRFLWRCAFPQWSDWNYAYTRKGVIRNRVRSTLKAVILAIALVTAFRMRMAGLGLASLTESLRRVARPALAACSVALERLRDVV